MARDPQAITIQGPDTAGNPVPVTIVPGGGGSGAPTELSGTTTVAAAAAVVTLTSAAGKTVYLTRIRVDGLGATSGTVVTLVITGLLGGSQTYQVTVVAGATTAIAKLDVELSRPLPASAANTNIVGTLGSFGTGNTAAELSLSGFLV